MKFTPFLAMAMIAIGWLWTLRAGVAIQLYGQEATPQLKRIAIGHAILSVVPFAFAVFLIWPRY